jgi:hypothetical protein
MNNQPFKLQLVINTGLEGMSRENYYGKYPGDLHSDTAPVHNLKPPVFARPLDG